MIKQQCRNEKENPKDKNILSSSYGLNNETRLV